MIASIHELSTHSIDFVLAFPQVDLAVDVFMETPMGMQKPKGPGCVLKLNKSLHGLKQASANWFEHLKTALKKDLSGRNFIQSKVDPCVFFYKDCIILCYVGNCVMILKEKSVLDRII